MGNIFDSFGQDSNRMLGQFPGSIVFAPEEKLKPVKKGPESALAWLDRRVEEMRVKL